MVENVRKKVSVGYFHDTDKKFKMVEPLFISRYPWGLGFYNCISNSKQVKKD